MFQGLHLSAVGHALAPPCHRHMHPSAYENNTEWTCSAVHPHARTTPHLPHESLHACPRHHAEHPGLMPISPTLRLMAAANMDLAAGAYERMAYSEAIEAIVAVCSRGNQYLEEMQPWTSLKKVRSQEETLVISHIAQGIARHHVDSPSQARMFYLMFMTWHALTHAPSRFGVQALYALW